ncbi:hypothetical protein J6590_053732 [Homalodisca vitripennis]|nr:hypothetical protein J6590_053732 [Homalodisca vitripennis]
MSQGSQKILGSTSRDVSGPEQAPDMKSFNNTLQNIQLHSLLVADLGLILANIGFQLWGFTSSSDHRRPATAGCLPREKIPNYLLRKRQPYHPLSLFSYPSKRPCGDINLVSSYIFFLTCLY